MTFPGRLKWGLEFARDLISSAPPQDSLALLTFRSRIEDSVTFGRDRAALLAEVDKLQHTDWARVKGKRTTALEDALISALVLLEPPRLGDAICLVSDGVENASQSNRSTVEILLESAGVRVYAFLPIWQNDSPVARSSDHQGASEMHDLATATGGDLLVYVPDLIKHFSMSTPELFAVTESDREDIAHASQDFYREVSSFIKLNVMLPQPLAKPLHWNLELLDASGRPNKHVQLLYPQRLAPCTPG
jgi:hypothetical protein